MPVGNRGTQWTVKVTVVNQRGTRIGVVTLSRTQPRVGLPVTASLTDPDGSISGLRWQWSRDTGKCSRLVPMTDIPGATSDTYTPVADDAEVTGAVADAITMRCSCGRRRPTLTQRATL